MINIFNVAVTLALVAPLVMFSELERCQRIGYGIGAMLWIVNLFVGNFALGAAGALILLVSCAKLIVEHFPIRL